MLYQALAECVVHKLGLESTAAHLDITSFHVDGDYADDDDGDSQGLRLTQGYGRDHRPELNQVILELIGENQAGIPVYMQALSGNTSDQKAFSKVVRPPIHSLKSTQQSRYFVGDAALYTAESITVLEPQKPTARWVFFVSVVFTKSVLLMLRT